MIAYHCNSQINDASQSKQSLQIYDNVFLYQRCMDVANAWGEIPFLNTLFNYPFNSLSHHFLKICPHLVRVKALIKYALSSPKLLLLGCSMVALFLEKIPCHVFYNLLFLCLNKKHKRCFHSTRQIGEFSLFKGSIAHIIFYNLHPLPKTSVIFTREIAFLYKILDEHPSVKSFILKRKCSLTCLLVKLLNINCLWRHHLRHLPLSSMRFVSASLIFSIVLEISVFNSVTSGMTESWKRVHNTRTSRRLIFNFWNIICLSPTMHDAHFPGCILRRCSMRAI